MYLTSNRFIYWYSPTYTIDSKSQYQTRNCGRLKKVLRVTFKTSHLNKYFWIPIFLVENLHAVSYFKTKKRFTMITVFAHTLNVKLYGHITCVHYLSRNISIKAVFFKWTIHHALISVSGFSSLIWEYGQTIPEKRTYASHICRSTR